MKTKTDFSMIKNIISGNMNECTIYYIINFFCIFAHIIYMIIFYIMHIPQLFALNIFSVALYCIMPILIKKQCYRIATSVMALEICFHSVIATLIAGWDCGFSLLLITLVPLIFYCNFKRSSTSYIFGGFIILTFFFLKILTFYYPSSSLMSNYLEVTTGLYLLNSFLCFGSLTIFSIVYSKSNNYTKSQLVKENKELKTVVDFDPLTGLLNRRSMIKILQENEEKRSAGIFCFSLILSDIDDFKRINDMYGHDCGDYVLKSLAKILKDSVKDKDSVCRWGGEEILISLSDATSEKAVSIAERIRNKIECFDFEYNNTHFKITLTLGVSSECLPIHEMVIQSDQRLYYGKRHGKNRVVG